MSMDLLSRLMGVYSPAVHGMPQSAHGTLLQGTHLKTHHWTHRCCRERVLSVRMAARLPLGVGTKPSACGMSKRMRSATPSPNTRMMLDCCVQSRWQDAREWWYGTTIASGSFDGTVLLWKFPVVMADTEVLGDLNGDGVVNVQDVVLIAASFGTAGENNADLKATVSSTFKISF